MKFDLTQTKMPYGTHKGTKICDLEESYLEWAANGGITDSRLQVILIYEWDKRRKKIMEKINEEIKRKEGSKGT